MPVTINGTTGIAGPDGSASTPAVQGTDSNTGLFFPAADTVAITTGGTQRVTVDSSGNLGLGVTPSAWRSVWRALQFGNSGALFARTDASYSVNVGGNFFNNTSNQDTYINSSFATNYQQSSGEHRWFTAPSGTANTAITSFNQVMTLDASGNLGVGTTTALKAVTSASNTVTNYQFVARDTRSMAAGIGGGIAFEGNDGTIGDRTFASVIGAKENATSGNYAGYLAFYSRPDGLAPIERARITSGGDFRVKGAGTAGSTDAFQVSGSAPADAARITSGGSLLVGRTNRQNSGTIEALGTGTQAFVGQVTNNGNSVFQAFNSSGSATFYVVGSGEIYSTSTTITAISDASQKENINPIAYGLNAICNLRPVKFDFKQGCGSEQKGLLGFIAQDVEPIIPELVKSFGNEGLKGLKTGDMIPVLVKAIQEQQALITSLTARVAALEGTQP